MLKLLIRVVSGALLLMMMGGTLTRAQTPTQPLFQLPDKQAPIVTGLTAGTGIQLLGRYEEGGWLYVSVNDSGFEGWLPESAISTGRDYSGLPPMGVEAADVLYNLRYWNFTPALKAVYEVGQRAGNRADRFSKVGDSITVNKAFLQPFADGVYMLGEDYGYLQPAIDFFGPTPEIPTSSFGGVSLAAGVGWTTRDLLGRANDPRCGASETRIICEYRINRPASALIMIGTNDAASLRVDQYDANLRRLVEVSLNMGVIPILSTLPPQPERDSIIDQYNLVIVQIADDYDVPLMNYWLVMQGLPGRGLTTDGIHPNAPAGSANTTIFTLDNLQYGYTVRNLMALHSLYYLLTEIIYAP